MNEKQITITINSLIENLIIIGNDEISTGKIEKIVKEELIRAVKLASCELDTKVSSRDIPE
jgi:hypothetical protein